MQDSILNSIKKLLNIAPECTDFDEDIIMHINTTFSILNQLGVGPKKCFMISSSKNIWSEFLPNDNPIFESVKSYIYLKVKLLFDPPINSSTLQSVKENISELEWRLYVEADNMDNKEVL